MRADRQAGIRRRLRVSFAAALTLLACAALLASRDQGQARPPAVHALLINGGDRPAINYLSHLQHLQAMADLLRRRGVAPARIHVFSADGEEDGADLATREVAPPDFWLIDGTALGNRLKPAAELISTRWNEVRLHPARREALREWFEAARQEILPGDQLLIFVTDHGTGGGRDPGNAAIALWQERITVREFQALLARLSPGVRIVALMSQCYSGAFAELMFDRASAEPSGDVCGFFSTTAAGKAYGCYPEGSEGHRTGHAFQVIDALGRRATLAEAHDDLLASDDTPDMPLRTSDVYLARLVAREAAARGLGAEAFADRLLGQAWRGPAAWETEVRLLDNISGAFGTSSPRRVGEIAPLEREITALAGQLRTSGDKWKAPLVQVKEFLLEEFLRSRPAWRSRLEQTAGQETVTLDRATLLLTLLPEVALFARERADAWQRLEQYQDYVTRGSEAASRLDVRKAALERMRTILVSIAGRALLDQADRQRQAGDPAAPGPSPQRQALARLQRCEAFAPGELPAGSRTPQSGPRAAFPPLSADVALREEIEPSWIGVNFVPAPPEARQKRRGLPAGAALLKAVDAGSPAEEAGLQAGDIVLGPPGQLFTRPQQLREWAMTAVRDAPAVLRVLRPGTGAEREREFEVTVSPRVQPVARSAEGDEAARPLLQMP
jgi:hypothetical protein